MEKTSEKNIYFLLFIYVLSILFICSKMSPLYVSNEWADPNIYFNVAKGMVNGRALYTEIFDHKGPFIFFIYAAGYLISNENFYGMFLIELVSWYILAVSLYSSSRLFLNKFISFIISTAFFIFLIKSMKAGGSAEEFILCMEGVTLYLFLKYFKADSPLHKPKYMFIHGLLVTAVLFTKINLIAFWIFPLSTIFINILYHKEYKNFIYNILTFISGALIICIPVVGYLYSHNCLEEAYKIYIELNSAYAKLGTPKNILFRLLSRILYLFLEPTCLFLLAFMGIFLFPFKYIKNIFAKVAIVFSGIILYTVIFMGKFQYYYPIPYLIFGFLGFIYVGIIFQKSFGSFYLNSNKSLIISMLIFIFTCAGMSGLDNTRVEAWILTDENYDRKALMTMRLKNEIMKVNNPTLLNLGFGLANNLFTTCNIVPNIKYFVTPNLSHKFYPQLRDEQFQYLKDKKTDFVIIQQYIPSNGYYEKMDPLDTPYSLKRNPILLENYKLILTDTIINTIDERAVDVYFLYKKK
jgi:hypothetical protein